MLLGGRLLQLTLPSAPNWMYRGCYSQGHGLACGLYPHRVQYLRRAQGSRSGRRVHTTLSGRRPFRLGCSSDRQTRYSLEASPRNEVPEDVQDGLCYLGSHGRLHDDLSSWTPNSFYLEAYIDLERDGILRHGSLEVYICIGIW